VIRLPIIAAALTFATPALAEQPTYRLTDPGFDLSLQRTHDAALKWEVAYLALSAIDTAQTISCLNRGECDEANPLFGRHPSSTKLIAAKVVFGAVHFAIFERLNDHNPKAALRMAQISAGLQGGVVLLNARFTFGGGK
jgi:hypothetical protein